MFVYYSGKRSIYSRQVQVRIVVGFLRIHGDGSYNDAYSYHALVQSSTKCGNTSYLELSPELSERSNSKSYTRNECAIYTYSSNLLRVQTFTCPRIDTVNLLKPDHTRTKNRHTPSHIGGAMSPQLAIPNPQITTPEKQNPSVFGEVKTTKQAVLSQKIIPHSIIHNSTVSKNKQTNAPQRCRCRGSTHRPSPSARPTSA